MHLKREVRSCSKGFGGPKDRKYATKSELKRSPEILSARLELSAPRSCRDDVIAERQKEVSSWAAVPRAIRSARV
ncbi:Phospholipase Ddhd2 [Manis pentadactyla]|nr:Phospholipase Ddhd2 [Manis pentadactyla]